MRLRARELGSLVQIDLEGVINETFPVVLTSPMKFYWEAIQNYFAVPQFAEASPVTAN